jgi:hypothetical protein
MKPSCATARTSLLWGTPGHSSGRHSRGGGCCHPTTWKPEAPRGPQEHAVKAEADSSAKVIPIIREAQKAGTRTLREIAEALNARGIAAARCLGNGTRSRSQTSLTGRRGHPWGPPRTSSALLRRSNLTGAANPCVARALWVPS